MSTASDKRAAAPAAVPEDADDGAVVLDLGTPNPRQAEFLRSKVQNVAYGGARGGGKSWAVQRKAVLLALAHPGIKIAIVRKTYPELTENHIKPLKALLRCGHPDPHQRIASYNDKLKEISFPNGSYILFKYCATDHDLDHFQGTEFNALFLDEATQFSEKQYQHMTACLRGVDDFPKRSYLTCNPGGQGHGWVKRLFVDRRYRDSEDPDDYVFIRAGVRDNAALMAADPDYIKRLQALPPKQRRAWLDGDFNVLDGQFFEEFTDDPSHYDDHAWTHVIRPFDIPPEWRVYRSYDYGYARPFSVGWWAMDYDGVLYRILEMYGCTETPNEGVKWAPERQFAEVRRVEREHPYLRGRKIRGIADPAIWGDASGISVADVAMKQGVYFDKGNNDRINGWAQLHYRMAFDDHGKAMLYVFDTCKAFIRTIPEMIYSTTRPEDLDTSLEDHVADESRYMCMTHAIKPRVRTVDVPLGDDPLNQRGGRSKTDPAISIFTKI